MFGALQIEIALKLAWENGSNGEITTAGSITATTTTSPLPPSLLPKYDTTPNDLHNYDSEYVLSLCSIGEVEFYISHISVYNSRIHVLAV